MVFNAVVSGGPSLRIRINGDTGSNYRYTFMNSATATITYSGGAVSYHECAQVGTVAGDGYQLSYEIQNYADAVKHTATWVATNAQAGDATANMGIGAYPPNTTAVTSLTILNSTAGTFTSGTYTLYGVK
jgi:hypothetical protein